MTEDGGFLLNKAVLAYNTYHLVALRQGWPCMSALLNPQMSKVLFLSNIILQISALVIHQTAYAKYTPQDNQYIRPKRHAGWEQFFQTEIKKPRDEYFTDLLKQANKKDDT